MSEIASFRKLGFAVVRQFFDAGSLANEVDQVMRRAFRSQRVTNYSGLHFQYVPMMTAETPVSLSLLDRSSALAETLLDGPVLPTRAKGTRYFGDTPWHRDSELPVTSIGVLAYCESLDGKNGALRVRDLTSREQVIETTSGDLIVMDEHLFHSSSGGEIRRQWRADFLRVPTNADELKNARAYFERIYPADWDGGYDVDRYPSYGSDWRNSGRPCVAELEKLGVYDLAAKQEAFTRSRWPLR
jgi:hypothetical protein